MSSVKDMNRLINDLNSDPNLVVDDNAHEYLEQQYPTAFHHTMHNFAKAQCTWKRLRSILRWSKSDTSELKPAAVADILSQQKKFRTMLILDPTVGNKWSELKWRNWRHRITNIVIDAYHACWKDTGASTDYARFLFKPSERINLSASLHEDRNVKGLQRFNKVLVDHPFVLPEDIDALIAEITDENVPEITAGLDAPDDETRVRSTGQLTAIRVSLKASIRTAQEANTVTFLVMLWDLIPGAKQGTSDLFSRICDHRDKHMKAQMLMEAVDRVPYTASAVLAFVKNNYVQNNKDARHIAWNNILLPIRLNRQKLYDWLQAFEPLVRAYTAAGSTPAQKKLTDSEETTVKVKIGRQINDREIIALTSISAVYGGTNMVTGTYDLQALKTHILENASRLPRFMHDVRTIENVTKDYEAHGREIPTFLQKKDDSLGKRRKPTPPAARYPRQRSTYYAEDLVKGSPKGHKGKHPNKGKFGRGKGYGPHSSGLLPFGKGKGKNKGKGKGKKGKGKGKDKSRGRGGGISSGTANLHKDKRCDFCHKVGHVKKNCRQYHKVQNSSTYLAKKTSQTPHDQYCLEILENSAGVTHCKWCFQPWCDYNTCISPVHNRADLERNVYYFSTSGMQDECIAAKEEANTTASSSNPSHPDPCYGQPPHQDGWHNHDSRWGQYDSQGHNQWSDYQLNDDQWWHDSQWSWPHSHLWDEQSHHNDYDAMYYDYDTMYYVDNPHEHPYDEHGKEESSSVDKSQEGAVGPHIKLGYAGMGADMNYGGQSDTTAPRSSLLEGGPYSSVEEVDDESQQSDE